MDSNDAPIARNDPRATTRAQQSTRLPTSQVSDAMIIADAIGKLCTLYTRFG
jgi:hypothetical protein